MPKCQYCKRNQALWAIQFIAEDSPTISLLGNHIRGFTVNKACEECKESVLERVKVIVILKEQSKT